MTDYVASCLLKGRYPTGVSFRRHFERPDLMAKLIRERQVARFIVAPNGYGKTALALEYAKTVFKLRKTIWIDARNPHFILYLDDETLVDSLLGMKTGKMLLVVEDVPLLDSLRTRRFMGAIDELLDKEVEVLVTCTPFADAFSPLRGRVRLCAKDLLVSDVELDASRKILHGSRDTSLVRLLPAEREAVMVWGDKEERQRFLQTLIREEIPDDFLLLLFILLVLGKGSLDESRHYVRFREEFKHYLEEDYLFAGVEAKYNRFETIPLDMELVMGAFAGKIDQLARSSCCGSVDELTLSLADALLEKGELQRACVIVKNLTSTTACLQWLDRSDELLCLRSCILPAHRLYKSRFGRCEVDPSVLTRLQFYQIIRLLLLHDIGAAIRLCDRLRKNPEASFAVRNLSEGLADVLVATQGREERESHLRFLAQTAAGMPACGMKDPKRMVFSSSNKGFSDCFDVLQAYESSFDEGVRSWLDRFEEGEGCFFFRILASLILWDAFSGRGPDRKNLPSTRDRMHDGWDDADPERPSLHFSKDFSRLLISYSGHIAKKAPEDLDLPDALFVISIERYKDILFPDLSSSMPDSYRLFSLHSIHLALLEQRTEYRKACEKESEEIRDFLATHPDMQFSRVQKEHREQIQQGCYRSFSDAAAPPLTVNLFGGLDVYVGDKRIDPSSFGRTKAKTLLALLVLNRGKEFPRDSLVSLLWPESSIECARKNLYSVLSSLRRLISTPSGCCPYLIRQRQSLKMNSELLTTDLEQFDRLCKILDYEQVDYGGWDDVCVQLDECFSFELLPGESDNPFIVSAKRSCKKRLTEGLLLASDRFLVAGDFQQSIHFAQEALKRDEVREDAYLALMRAQLARGQRTLALETFITCRDILRDRLGIYPSGELVDLHYAIITEEGQESLS